MRRGIALIGALLASSIAGASEFHLLPSDRAPSAGGVVDADREGANTRVEVEVKGLVSPMDTHDPYARGYVVWAAPLDGSGAPQNLGMLNQVPGKAATLKTLTPLTRFSVFVTPEADARTLAPTGPHLLTGVVVPKS